MSRSRRLASCVAQVLASLEGGAAVQPHSAAQYLQGCTHHVVLTGPTAWHHRVGPRCSSINSTGFGSQGLRAYGAAATAAVQQQAPQAQAQQLPQLRQQFRVQFVTGNLRGAGTDSAALVQLVGTGGMSERVLVGSGDDCHFNRASRVGVTVQAPLDFGTLRRVHVEKLRDPNVTGDGWYLQHVEVESPGGAITIMPCHSWFGESDCGGFNGHLERNLLPAVPDLEASRPAPVKVSASGVAIPHYKKVLQANLKGRNTRTFGWGGEDAYFVTCSSGRLFGMGVADGVFMWREQGIDSGAMSRLLMETCKEQVEAGVEDVFKTLHVAEERVREQHVLGSATICLLNINEATGQLHSANLGDSGFLVFSPGKSGKYELKFRTNQLERSFGCPYQLGHHESANKVEDSDLASFFVHAGDIIVMGSDGLLDNVSDQDMLQELQTLHKQGVSPPAMAQHLTKLAFEAAVDKRRITPYSKGASEAFNMVYSGGKPDDITVLVAVCS